MKWKNVKIKKTKYPSRLSLIILGLLAVLAILLPQAVKYSKVIFQQRAAGSSWVCQYYSASSQSACSSLNLSNRTANSTTNLTTQGCVYRSEGVWEKINCDEVRTSCYSCTGKGYTTQNCQGTPAGTASGYCQNNESQGCVSGSGGSGQVACTLVTDPTRCTAANFSQCNTLKALATNVVAAVTRTSVQCRWCTGENQCKNSGCQWRGYSSYCQPATDGTIQGCCECGSGGGSSCTPRSTCTGISYKLYKQASSGWTEVRGNPPPNTNLRLVANRSGATPCGCGTDNWANVKLYYDNRVQWAELCDQNGGNCGFAYRTHETVTTNRAVNTGGEGSSHTVKLTVNNDACPCNVFSFLTARSSSDAVVDSTTPLVAPACRGVTAVKTNDKRIRANFTFAGNNSSAARLVSGCYYRRAGTSNWVTMRVVSGTSRGAGSLGGLIVCQSNESNLSSGQYEVIGSINVFTDVNGNGAWDSTEPRSYCFGKYEWCNCSDQRGCRRTLTF